MRRKMLLPLFLRTAFSLSVLFLLIPSRRAPLCWARSRASCTIPATDPSLERTSSSMPLTLTSPSTRTPTPTEPSPFLAVPAGVYIVTVTSPGFATLQQTITVTSNGSEILHFPLAIAAAHETTVVQADASTANPDTVTPTTLVSRVEITQTPGADRTNSLAMITDFTPGAYLTHDMLHMRGGHQTTWLIDGVPIPNTNIATNLAPQIDPKDIDYVEVLRGSYDAAYGDRTYGEFNVLPRSGFEKNNDGELVTTFGNFYQTNEQVNFGGHTEKFAYYASVNGNRSNLGLETPVAQVYHDAENGYGGFTSLLYNLNPKNQFRFDGQLRQDYYQIPYDPDPNDFENQQFDTHALRDGQKETDGYAIFSWIHTFSQNAVLTVSPFYHYNNASYNSPSTDEPLATTDHHTSTYGGGQAVVSFHLPKNDVQGRNLRLPRERQRALRPDFQRRKRKPSDPRDRHRSRLRGSGISQRQILRHVVAHTYRRSPRDPLFIHRHREHHLPAHRRHAPHPASQLGFPRFLGTLLSAASSRYSFRSLAQLSRFCQPVDSHFV
jgi:hypothetical protein